MYGVVLHFGKCEFKVQNYIHLSINNRLDRIHQTISSSLKNEKTASSSGFDVRQKIGASLAAEYVCQINHSCKSKYSK